jgi:hypothetical protein
MNDDDRFNIVVREIIGQRLTWDQLTGKLSEEHRRRFKGGKRGPTRKKALDYESGLFLVGHFIPMDTAATCGDTNTARGLYATFLQVRSIAQNG